MALIKFKLYLIKIIIISLISSILTDSPPSYIKVIKSEKATLKDLNKDFINMGLASLVNNITFVKLNNYSSSEFPGEILDLSKISSDGSEFSISNKALIANSDSSSVLSDTSSTSFIFFTVDYSYKNTTLQSPITGNFSVTVKNNELIYIKDYQKVEFKPKIVGKISFVWKDPTYEFLANSPTQKFLANAFSQLFSEKIKNQIENELNFELNKYLSKINFDTKISFILNENLSQIAEKQHQIFIRLQEINTITLSTKYETLLNYSYDGFYSSIEFMTLPAAQEFDIKAIDTKSLYQAMFIDRFLFEYLIQTFEFQGFFIRREIKSSDIPEGLKIEMNMRQLAKILPEISYIYSLVDKVYVNFAFFNPKLQFNDNKPPRLIVNLDFTFYSKNSEGNFKQIFTCQTDLGFDINIINTKTFLLNFDLKLANVSNYKMSNNFSIINLDYLKFVISELVNYGIEKNKIKLLQKDMDISDIFEEKFQAKFFNGGILLYNNLD